MRFGPVAFLFMVVIGWAAIRVVMLWPEAPPPDPGPRIAWQPPLQLHQDLPTPFGLSVSKPSLPVHPSFEAKKERLREAQPERDLEIVPDLIAASPAGILAGALPGPVMAAGQRERLVSQAGLAPFPALSTVGNFSLSAWAIVRGDVSPGLATGGQLGGSQAGFRARYRLAPSLDAAARVSGPLGSALGKEAALALDWRPARSAPVMLTIERRVGLDRGGRDAFAVGMFGGFDRLALPAGLHLDGYAQAGVVGARRRDAYVDGSLRAERKIGTVGRASLGLGIGVWGGAQPGATRLDIGPQLVAHVPIATGGLRIGAEWRNRIVGDARPGSGPVVSLGADF